MTHSEEIAELRRFMREDIAALHSKLEKRDARLYDILEVHVNDRNKDMRCVAQQLAKLDKKASINTLKLTMFTSSIAMIIATVVHFMAPLLS